MRRRTSLRERSVKGMTNEQAINMLKAKLECSKRATSGTDFDCNNGNCDECSLCYEQGNMLEQKEALDMAIKAMASIETLQSRIGKTVNLIKLYEKLEQQPCEDDVEILKYPRL